MRTWFKSKFPGVRFYKHPTRKQKNGISYDAYFTVRYRLDGKLKEEGLGWATEGWTAEKANEKRGELSKARRTGEGPVTVAEARQKAAEERDRDKTVTEYFNNTYLPEQEGKHPRSLGNEKQLFRDWIEPVIGNLPLNRVAQIHVERIKRTMMDKDNGANKPKGRSPRTIEHCLTILRKFFRFAMLRHHRTGDNPALAVDKPKVGDSNMRLRYLSKDEATTLLDVLEGANQDVHNAALLSLHAGLRASEVLGLTWGQLDLKEGAILLGKTKSGEPRVAVMTAAVRAMLQKRKPGAADLRVFPGRDVRWLSATFGRLVAAHTTLNANVADSRMKVVFHSLRHTFATWQLAAGADVPTLQKLMGHKTLVMVMRYAKIAPATLRAQMERFEAALTETAVPAAKTA